ncbi:MULTISPECIES: hypothetical protein [unclassified Streptomyces]|uniref:hypothetical protein n=1 Tax=unclassified Streptomyces TaxID=2593676 RepID=UPI001F040E14|nr:MULTISPECIES: hypothetical protein [unclassified Streptomyces]MCH0562983.1 hypothetical protein [Streptomyces sp. MUM 2J]MCH0571943.1 hypothetical protein [Streptomyces sp. MUM 136J]
MDHVTLACAVLPLTAVLYGLRVLGRRRDRAAAEHRAAALRADPYRAAADRRWAEDDTQAAAARLLLDGLATVDHRANLGLTASGADPARSAGHPLPDALLTALRRRTVPATLGRIEFRDTAFRAAREEFHTAWRSGLPRSGRGRGCFTAAWVLLFAGETSFTVAALFGSAPRGPVQWAAAAATGFALFAQLAWINGYGRQDVPAAGSEPRAEGRARTALHPALVELASRDPQSRDRLRASRRRDRGRRPRGRSAPSAPGT